MKVRLSDHVIALRPFQLSDVEAHLAGEDEEQIKWLSGGVSAPESVRNWIIRNLEYWQHDGPVFNFAITQARNDALIGMIEANTDHNQINGMTTGEANISYGIYPDARGQGNATRAVELMMRFLRSRGCRAAIIRVHTENAPSIRVAERSGFLPTQTTVEPDGVRLRHFRKDL